MSRNCNNCGAPIDKDVCKCPYCGTLYYDLTMFEDGKPCYVKFRTSIGIITALAIPCVSDINVYNDTINYSDFYGRVVKTMIKSQSCDINVTFKAIGDRENKSLFVLSTNEK